MSAQPFNFSGWRVQGHHRFCRRSHSVRAPTVHKSVVSMRNRFCNSQLIAVLSGSGCGYLRWSSQSPMRVRTLKGRPAESLVRACFAVDPNVRCLVSCAHTIDSDQTGGLHDVERKVRSEAQARCENHIGARSCRFVVASGWRRGRDERVAGGGPAYAKDRAEPRTHPRRGRAFRRQPVDLLCLRQRERQASTRREGRLAGLRRLSLRWRLPLRWGLARLRCWRLRLRRLLRVMGTLPHLLKAHAFKSQHNKKSPSQHSATGRGPNCASSAHRTGATIIRPNA